MRTRLLRLLFALLLVSLVTFPPVARLAAADTCHWNQTCPPGSPTNWSAYSACGRDCGFDSYCSSKGTDATLELRERYRFVRYQDGSECLEYEVATFRLHCGCVL